MPDTITIEPEVLPDIKPVTRPAEPSPWKFPAPAVDPTPKG